MKQPKIYADVKESAVMPALKKYIAYQKSVGRELTVLHKPVKSPKGYWNATLLWNTIHVHVWFRATRWTLNQRQTWNQLDLAKRMKMGHEKMNGSRSK